MKKAPPPTTVLTVRLDQHLLKELKRIAKAEDRPLSNLIRRFLQKGVDDGLVVR